jgi:hypothetical protein
MHRATSIAVVGNDLSCPGSNVIVGVFSDVNVRKNTVVASCALVAMDHPP